MSAEPSRPRHTPATEPPWWRRRDYQIAGAVMAGLLVTIGASVALISGGHHAPTGVPIANGSAAGSASTGPEASTAPPPGAAAGPGVTTKPRTVSDQIRVTNSGSIKDDRHTLRVISAYGDLTGKRELAWAADAGHPVGAARCTQNFKFNPGTRVGRRSTMLLCWRTSPTKSVATVAVDLKHRPSETESAATIDKVWRQMG
jgi:hypothetical protein